MLSNYNKGHMASYRNFFKNEFILYIAFNCARGMKRNCPTQTEMECVNIDELNQNLWRWDPGISIW